MTGCATEAELSALGRGLLPPAEADALRAHLAGCATCSARLLREEEHDTAGTPRLDPGPGFLTGADALDWRPGHDLGRYVILLTLGKGGMGVVYRAYDKELDRAVALKLLHGADDEAGRAQLLREAQAMARLSNPNVVAVHDVVVLEGRVCVVTELVEGETVRQWLKQEPRRPWREILAVFRAAAEGLAAAHDASLVHRDFKPDNVLVARDGRVRVTDFGIACLASTAPGSGAPVGAGSASGTPPAAEPGAVAPTLSSGPGSARAPGFATLSGATRSPGGPSTLAATALPAGMVVGTPRYMAPEQFAQASPDFRTDQFSFAVALAEALHGRHPFAGESHAERLENARRGAIQPPPPGSAVPQWVQRILARALAPDPSQRFASMRELNAALGRDPSQRRNRTLVAAGVAAAILLASVAAVRAGRARAELCTGSERKLAGVWDPHRREQVRAAFAATGVPFAGDSFARAAETLDGYTAQWTTTFREACEATSVRGEQSPQVLTLRMGCLQDRLDAVATLTELFTRADPGLVGKAKQSLDALPRLATCSDVARLTAKLPPPEDPAAAAEVERVRKELTRARMLMEAGRTEEAALLVGPAHVNAERIGYSPLRTEAELAQGVVTATRGKYPEAIGIYTRAFASALADGYDELLTSCAVRLAGATTRLHQNERALEWTTLAESANRRARDPEMAVMILNSRGNIARNKGDFAAAAVAFAEGAQEARTRLGPEHMSTLGLSYNHASTLQNLGRYREATGEYTQVIATARRVLGPKHPFLSFPLIGSGNVAQARGHLDEAKPFFEEVLALTGGKGMNADNAYYGLGDIALEQGRTAEAMAHYQAAQRVDEALYPGGSEFLVAVAKEGKVLLRQGAPERAWVLFEDALARGAKLGDDFDSRSVAQLGEAEVLLARGKAAQALAAAQAAEALVREKRGKAHPITLEARLQIAQLRAALGQRAAAAEEASAVIADARAELEEQHPLVVRARALIAEQTGAAAASR